MRIIGIILIVILQIILIPLYLIDFIFFAIPRAIVTMVWRRRLQPGDPAYFVNKLGDEVRVIIRNVREDNTAWVDIIDSHEGCESGCSQTVPLNHLYPESMWGKS